MSTRSFIKKNLEKNSEKREEKSIPKSSSSYFCNVGKKNLSLLKASINHITKTFKQ